MKPGLQTGRAASPMKICRLFCALYQSLNFQPTYASPFWKFVKLRLFQHLQSLPNHLTLSIFKVKLEGDKKYSKDYHLFHFQFSEILHLYIAPLLNEVDAKSVTSTFTSQQKDCGDPPQWWVGEICCADCLYPTDCFHLLTIPCITRITIALFMWKREGIQNKDIQRCRFFAK